MTPFPRVSERVSGAWRSVRASGRALGSERASEWHIFHRACLPFITTVLKMPRCLCYPPFHSLAPSLAPLTRSLTRGNGVTVRTSHPMKMRRQIRTIVRLTVGRIYLKRTVKNVPLARSLVRSAALVARSHAPPRSASLRSLAPSLAPLTRSLTRGKVSPYERVTQ